MQIQLPNESAAYRQQRDKLLQAEAELRQNIEAVAQLRRSLPLGGECEDYVFASGQGDVRLSELFGKHDTLILYSFMYSEHADAPCPMCSAFLDSLVGQLQHVQQRCAFAVVARSSVARLTALSEARHWQPLRWLSAAQNNYPRDYLSELPDGEQVPMCNVFVRRDGRVHHFWASELLFHGWQHHPRHLDMLWPLWHFFDLLPEGRGSFMPNLDYTDTDQAI